MLVSELFKRLSYGPFSNLAIGGEGNGTITVAKQPQVIDFTNEALLRLHSRFVLSEKEVIIQQSELITKYEIDSIYSVSQAGNPAFVIDSLAHPFLDDILKISAVYDGEGCQYPLNRDNDPTSLFTPQINLLQVPVPVEGKPLHVLYQARPIPLALDPINMAAEIELPAVLDGALIAYVAHLVYGTMNGQEHTAKAQEYLQKYDGICMEVIERDLVSSSLSLANYKLDERGFV